MKRNWTHDELVETFSLLPEEQVLLEHKTPPSQLGFAALLKFVQHEGRFPTYRHEIPPAVITHLAHQLVLDPALAFQYEWQGRTVEQHRAQIRTFLGLHESTSHALHDLADWLCTQVAPQENRLEHIKAAADDGVLSSAPRRFAARRLLLPYGVHTGHVYPGFRATLLHLRRSNGFDLRGHARQTIQPIADINQPRA